MRSPAGATGPFNRVVWPWEPVAGAPLVWDPDSAARLPSVGRALALYAGMIKQMPMDDVRGDDVLPRPRLLDQPDPNSPRSWYVGLQIEDYLRHGNALSYVTAYDAADRPAASVWLPAAWVSVMWDRTRPLSKPLYYVDGFELDTERVVHVKRGADRWFPVKGVGVVAQHLQTLDRAALEEEYERDALRSGAVPSVAVITPNPKLGQEESDTAKADWLAKFGGPTREPAILPFGTQVIPLAWSPTDAQLEQARKLTLVDVANAFNLDGYWLGAPASSLTYRSPGPMYLNLLRVSLEPILADFEDTWSMAWLPRGRRVRFYRNAILRDDFATTVTTVNAAIASGLMSVAEGRAYAGLPPATEPPPPAPAPAPPPPAESEQEESTP